MALPLSLDPATVEALREWLTVKHSEQIFFDRDYQGQRFNRFAERCGLPRIRLHDMRHAYATISLKSSVNPKIVSARLGHASVGFTLTVYSHALAGMDRDAANDIAAWS